MTIYVFCYDLRGGDDHDYQNLYDRLEELGSHRIQDSVWLVDWPTSSAAQLHRDLRAHMHERDRTWISQVHRKTTASNEYTYEGALSGTTAWLERHPPQ